MRHAQRRWGPAASVLAVLGACNASSESSEPAHTVTPAPQAAPEQATQPQTTEAPMPSGMEPPPSDEHAQATATPEPGAAEPTSTTKGAESSTGEGSSAKPVPSGKPAVEAPKPAPAPSPEAEPPAPPEPTKAPEPLADKPKPHTKVASTKHVRVDVTAGMQKLLDADPRMEPWIASVISVADKCYADIRAKSATAAGDIKVRVTMHANARPTPDVRSLPPQLSSMVVCATGKLMSQRMPLFTGPEGEKHDLTIHFTP